MKTKKWAFSISFLFLFLLILSACGNKNEAEKEKQGTEEKGQEEQAWYKQPSLDELKNKDDPFSQSVKKGHELFMKTDGMLPENVGNRLSCASCHGDAGLDSSINLVGVAAVYPQYNARAGKVVTIEDRINGCFLRSMNGKELDPAGDDMRAMVSYLSYIATDVPTRIEDRPWVEKNKIENLPKPNVANGEKLYKQSCMQCHGADGSGTGATTGPALWGDGSFNIGAGMARIKTTSGFIQRNMPKGAMGGIKQGELTDQQAADLAGFILSHDRPDFAGKENDWPNGDAPDDAAYETKAKKTKPAIPQGGEGETKK